MNRIRLIEKDTNISKLKMVKIDWDVLVRDRSYQVVRIDGYVHTIGGKWGENNLWMYPRDEEPSYDNLVEYQGKGGACWGYKYEPYNYIRCKWGEHECFTAGGVMIIRNGEDFYFCRTGIDEARYLMNRIDEHPLNLNSYKFDEQMIGRKVWWRSEPAVITHWVEGQACVILEPDGIDNFTMPAEFLHDEIMNDRERDIKADIFDNHIWWFRE